jgi:glucose/mannose transport system substrate-binding protein
MRSFVTVRLRSITQIGSRFLSVLLLSIHLVPAATAAAPAAAVTPQAGSLVFYHWWISSSESLAIGGLIDAFQARHPGVSISSPAAPAGASNVFPLVKSLVTARRAPDAFQMHAAYGAQVFLDAGLLAPTDDIWAATGLEKVVPPVVREMSRLDGHYYSIPLSVHRVNVVWYNKPLLERNGIDPATLTTWDAFFKAADTLRRAGVRDPIQVGKAWTAAMAFQGIVASQGIGVYEDWVNGKITNPRDPRLIEALSTFKRYLAYVNADHKDLGWDTAIERVVQGDAAFCVMGDWANGQFRVAGMRYGKDYGAMPVPGTHGMYAMTVDTFLRPRYAANPVNSERWLKTASSREGQDAFNVKKGSIAPRSDADVSQYDAYQRSAIADLKAARHPYPSLDSAAPNAFRTQLNEIVETFAADRDTAAAAQAIASLTTKLSGLYVRTWKLQ